MSPRPVTYGTRRFGRGGYIRVKVGPYGQEKMEHVLIVEEVLGYVLPEGVQVHHVNDNGTDNRKGNLCVCQDAKYHKGLHVRRRVLRAGGDPFLDRICQKCHIPKPIATAYGAKSKMCRLCTNERMREVNRLRRLGLTQKSTPTISEVNASLR